MQRLLFLYLLLVPLSTMARKALVVYSKDDSKAVFLLDNGTPQLMIRDDEVCISLGDYMNISYPIVNVKTFTIEDVGTTIVVAPQSVSQFHLLPLGLSISGLADKESVLIYDISGKLISQSKADTNGNVFIKLSRGQYIVKTNSKTFKLFKQ